jgi:hypothetical protein
LALALRLDRADRALAARAFLAGLVALGLGLVGRATGGRETAWQAGGLVAGHVIDTEICARGLPEDTEYPELKSKLAEPDEVIGDIPVVDVPETMFSAIVGDKKEFDAHRLPTVKFARLPYHMLCRKPKERFHVKESKQFATPKVIVNSRRFGVRLSNCEIA